MSEIHLKSYQHYADLYDRHTVERCRRIEERSKDDTDLPNAEGFSEEDKARLRKMVQYYPMYFETGERYLNREKRIREWMDRDRKKDELYENAQAPEDIRCLTCRNRLTPTSKELWTELDKEDRVLFMYDCPNKCLPHRAFFSTGEEWRVEPNLCLKCRTPLDASAKDTGEKLVTTYTCPNCGYIETDEYVWHHKKEKEEDTIDLNFAKDRDRFCLTEEKGKEYQDAKWRLEQLGKLGKEMEEEQKRRDEKLKENPKGFHLEGAGYTCFICRDSTKEGDNWYDEYGIKCLVCQKAIDEGEIPALLAKDRDNWYSKYDLEDRFNLKGATLNKWIKEGIIKVRTVSYYGKGVHEELFLIEDNKDFLPPKKLVESQLVEEKRDGKIWTHSEPWYRFVDPFEHLKDYGIMKYMRIVPEEEMKQREEEKAQKQKAKQERRELLKAVRAKKGITRKRPKAT